MSAMAPPQPEVAAFPAPVPPAAPGVALRRGPLFRCRPCGSGSCVFPEHVAETPGKRRRASTLSCSTGTATQPADGDAASTAIHRRVQNMQLKHFDPSSGRYVFLSFAQQLQQQLQQHVSPLHRTSALDLLEQQNILLRHNAGCAGIQRLISADDSVSRGKLQSASDLDYSAFRAIIQDYVFARNPPYLAALLTELRSLSSSLPLLLLERERVVQLLLSHIVHEDCCTAVLALLPALAKDLRAELVPYLPSIFSTLLLVLQQSQTAADAECLNRLFGCISNLFRTFCSRQPYPGTTFTFLQSVIDVLQQLERYLAKPLLKDFRAFLDLYLPWLCGVVAAPARAAPCSETYKQAAECRSLRRRIVPPSADAGPSPENDSASCSSLANGANAKARERKAPKRTRPMFRGSRGAPEVQVLAAQAFACLLRKAAADEDEGVFLLCANELMKCFNRCSPASWPVLAEVFGRVLFETVRSFHHTLSSSFDRLLRFLLATVLFQKPYKEVTSSNEYSPAAAVYRDPDTSDVIHPTAGEKDIRNGALSPEEDNQVAVTRERKRRRRTGDEDCDAEGPSKAEEIAGAEPFCEEEASCRTTEQSEHRYLRQELVTSDVCQSGSGRGHVYDNEEEFAKIPDASSIDGKRTSCTFPYFYQVKCVETLITLVRLHAGNMQSKAAVEVQTLLLEFLGAALRASGTMSKHRVKLSGKAGARAAGSEYNLTTAVGRHAGSTRLNGSTSCDDGDAQRRLPCGKGCHMQGSPDFHEFLHSSFLPYFYERPSPRPLTSHPYFRSCGAWLSLSEPDMSSFLRRKPGSDNDSCRNSSVTTSTQQPVPASTRVKNIFFSGYGLLTLLELVGEWFAAIPRLEGNADAFAERLLRVLAPYALPGNSRERLGLEGNQTVCTPDGVVHVPTILHSLLDFLRFTPAAKSSQCAGLRGNASQMTLPGLPRLLEATAVFALMLPCALLRLMAITWRAAPKSFVAAISTVAPDLLSSLLVDPQMWGRRLPRASCQQDDRSADDTLNQHQQSLPSTGSSHSKGCWRRRVAELYLDCCLAFVALLQHPELLVAESETDPNPARDSVDGFSAYVLRPAFKFLVLCFAGQLPEVSFPCQSLQKSLSPIAGSSGDAAAEFLSNHTANRSGRHVITCSHWRRSACGVLLAEELRCFIDIFRCERVLWSTDAYMRHGLNELMSALDELICWANPCGTGGVGISRYATSESEETHTDVFMYAWGLMTWAKPLIAWLSAPSGYDTRSETAYVFLQDESDEESVRHAYAGIAIRMIKVVFLAIDWVVGGLTASSTSKATGEFDYEPAGWNQEQPITSEGQRSCSSALGQTKTLDMLDEPKRRANRTDEKSSVIAFQVVRQCLDCLFTLATGGRFLGAGISVPSPEISHVQWLLQRLARVHASEGGHGSEKCLKGSATNRMIEDGDVRGIPSFTTQATSEGHFMACNILNMLLRGYNVSGDSSESATDDIQMTCADDVATVEMQTSSAVAGLARNGNYLDVASAAAKWVGLLLSVFCATRSSGSSSNMKPFMLPLLQCSLDCLQTFVMMAQSRACSITETSAMASTTPPIASDALFNDSAVSVVETILSRRDNALEHDTVMVLASISASLPALLACLSAPCRSLRLTVGRFLLHCNTACRLLVSGDTASGFREIASTSPFSARLNTRGMLVDDGAKVFFSSYRELFQVIVDLESTEIGLSEERRLTRLVEQLGRSVLPVSQEDEQQFWDHKAPAGSSDSPAGCRSLRRSSTPPVLLALECATRVLVAHFSIRFTPVWQAAADALTELAQQAEVVDKRSTRVFPSSMMGGKRESEQPVSVLADRCVLLLPTMWRIVIREVRRAEDTLDEWHALAHCDDKRGSSAQQRGRQEHCAENYVCGSPPERSSGLSSSGNSTSLDGCASGSTGPITLEGGSGSRAIVHTAWHEAGAETADDRDLLGHGVQESDPLSRHTQLLRVIESINRITVAGADVSGGVTGRSVEPPRGCSNLPSSVHTGKDEPATESLYGETRENSGNTFDTECPAPRAEATCTTLRGNVEDSPEVVQSADPTASRGVTDVTHATRICLLRRLEGLKRTCWTLFEALRLVGALVDDSCEEWSCEGEDHAHAGAPRRQKARQDKSILVAAVGFAPSRTSRVSLVPRACNVLRAVVALGTTHVPSRLPRALPQQVRTSSNESMREVFPADGINSIDEADNYAYLAEIAMGFWTKLLACCAQRLITIADSTLQHLSIQVLQLSPSLRSQLQPYAPLLDQLIASKSISDLLLRMRITGNRQGVPVLKLHDTVRPDEDDDEECGRPLEARDIVNAKNSEKDAALQGDFVIRREHKDLVLPLLVRLLLTKVQQRATKRSSSTSFSLRRTILSFISSVAVEELPLVLAVLFHPLTSAGRVARFSRASYIKEHNAVRRADEAAEEVREPSTTDTSSARHTGSSEDAAGASTTRDGFSSEANLPVFTTPGTKQLISGFTKEEALRRVVLDSTSLAATGIEQDEDNLIDQVGGSAPEATRDGQSIILSADTETVTLKPSDTRNERVVSDAALVIAETKLSDGSSVAITLAPACLPPQPLTRLRGSLETLKHLQELVGKLLRPAAPFLVQFYCTLLRQLAGKRTFPGTCCDVTSTASMASTGSELDRRNAKEARLTAEPSKAISKSVYQKAVVQSTLFLLKQLLQLFPGEATIWQKLMRPAGNVFQQLLDAAIETAAASPAYSSGPAKNGTQEKKSIPAIISLVASWAAHPAYYGFFTTVLPNALTALFKVPAAPSVLRAVCLRDSTVHKNLFFAGKNMGVLDAVIEIALHLSCGTSVEDHDQHLRGISHGSRRGGSQYSWEKRTRNRRAQKSESESSSEAESFHEKEEEMSSAFASTLVRQNAAVREREQQELCHAAQYQREGMTILQPYLPVLLRSLEILFQQRSKSVQRVIEVSVSGPLQATDAHAGATSHCEDSVDIGTRNISCGKTDGQDHGSPSVVLRMKELQLLTHIAQYTADKYEESQHRIRFPGAVTAQRGRKHADKSTSAVTPEENNLTCSLFRLLLQCLWSCSSRGRVTRRAGGVGEVRRVLTLQALRRLTLPLATHIRALLAKGACGVPQCQSSQLPESSEATTDGVISGSGCVREESHCDFSSGSEENHTYASDASVDALRLTIRSCCRLLQEANNMQCRVATSELLLAAELAACGLSHSDELFNDVREEVGAFLRQKESDESNKLRTLNEGAGSGETSSGLPAGDSVVDALLPGGFILGTFLERAIASSRSRAREGDSDPVMNEGGCQNQDGHPGTIPWAAKSASRYGESKDPQRRPGERHDFSNVATPIVSVLAEHRRRGTSTGIVDKSEAKNSEQLSHAEPSYSLEQERITRTRWRLGMGLILLSLNAVKSYGQRLAYHTTLGDGDEAPDSDVQIIILSSLAERCIDIQISPRSRPSALKNEAYVESRGAAEESVWDDTHALRSFKRHTLTVSATEPLVRQCLYLLSSPVVEWSVQQAALNIIKRLVHTVVSCAMQYSSAGRSHCNSSYVDAVGSLTCSSTSNSSAVVALPRESGSKGGDTSWTQQEFVRLWQAVSIHVSGILNLLEESVMPSAYLQLKQSDEAQWRTGVQILEHVVRSFAPAAPFLASLMILSERGTSAATVCSMANTQKHLTRLQRVFCLDLACLLLRTSSTHNVVGVLTSERSGDSVGGTVAAQAVVSAASGRNAGGDFFLDLLHVQRHRRGRALHRMAGAVEGGFLSRSTLQIVGLPLSLGAVIQRESCISKKQSQRHAKHRYLFHEGLCEQGLKCLEACCARIPWKRCLKVIQVLAGFLIRLPERETYIYKAICGAVRAFEEHVKRAGGETGSDETLTAGPADSDSKIGMQPSQRRPRGSQETRLPKSGHTNRALGAPALEGHFVNSAEAAGPPVPLVDVEEEDENKNIRVCKDSLIDGISEGLLPGHSTHAGVHMLERLQTCIRAELLPLLLRLAFRRRQTKSAKQNRLGDVDACSGGRRSVEHVRGKDDGKEMNPTLVVVCILLMQLLPPAAFEEQLPRLIRLVGFRLRSREREVRRQARGALVSVAVQLGSKYLSFLVTELSAIMQSTSTKGKRSQGDDDGAGPKGPQAFLNSVLLFTLHAMIHSVIHPQRVQCSQASDESSTSLQLCGEIRPALGGVMTDISRCSTASATGKPSSAASEKLAAGFFDEAFPILLPLVAEELFRTCDSDRPFDITLKTDKQNAKHDEAKHMKGAGVIFLLASVCSPASCEALLIPFFSALLSGRKLVCVWAGGDLQPCESRVQQRMIIRQRQGFSSAAAFSSAYLERVRELFFYLAKGLNINSDLTVGFKVKLSRRLLVMATSIMQQQCLHPLKQFRSRRKELVELALAQQQVELSTTRFVRSPLQRAPLRFTKHSGGVHLSGSAHLASAAETSHVDSTGGDKERPHLPGPNEVVGKSRHARWMTLYYEAVKDDMKFFRNVFLLAPMQDFPDGSAGELATSYHEEESAHCVRDDRIAISEFDTPSGISVAVRVAELDRRENLRLAVATRKDRTMLTQPGAASGKSLEQAGAAHRTAKGRGGGGFEDSSRAAAIGEAALRLLLFTLKKHKTELRDGRDTLVPTRRTAKHIRQNKRRNSDNSAVHQDTEPEGNSQGTDSFHELEKCVENVVCCMCSTDNNLIAWSARCLIYLIGLKLHEVTRLGCVISYSALKIFQVAGEIATAAQQKQQQMLLAPCTRLLTLLLLRPQASLWVDKALYGGRDIPRTQGEFLRQQMRKQAQHQAKVARAQQTLPGTTPSTKTFLTNNGSLSTLMTCHPVGGQQIQTAGTTGGRFAARKVLVAGGSNGCNLYTQFQAQLLQAEQEELPVEADAKQQQVKFREALVAQITHALEHPQTRLSALMLFKSVVLPHYREVAAQSLIRKGEDGSNDDFAKDFEPKADHLMDAAPRKRRSLAECWLLQEVYRCVDVIARLMIQEAGDVGENKRLAELSADVYVHFLLNFPMTVKVQQRKVLFLIKNLGYSTVDGRRAVLNCLHKLLSRFPYELTMEKYSDVMMVSLCRRLVLEDDPVTHSMLRMLVGQIMQISEDLQDGRHSSLSVLRTCAEVLLRPKVTNLLAIEELILVYLDLQASLPEQSVAPRVLPILHRALELGETAHSATGAERMNVPAPGVVSCCKHGCCDRVDWRVCYKALLIFEKLLLSTHPSELDKLFAKTVNAVQQTCRSSNSTHHWRGTSESTSGPSMRVIKLLYDCRYPATDHGYTPTMLLRDLPGGTNELSGAAHASRIREAQDLEAETDASISAEAALRMDLPDAASALALARLWHMTAGVGITHSHPWIRAASFRCAGIYLGARVNSGFNQNVPCLFYLPLDDLSLHDGSGQTVTGFSRDRTEHSTTMQVDQEIERQQDCTSFSERTPQTTVTDSGQRVSCFSNPGVTLFLSALKSLGEDVFLERSPQAVPAVYALLIPLLKLAVEIPDLLRFARERESEVSRWQRVGEQAGGPFSSNLLVKRDAQSGCGRGGLSMIQTNLPVTLTDPLTLSVCRIQVKDASCTEVAGNEVGAERKSENRETFLERQPDGSGSLREPKRSLQGAANDRGETTVCSSWRKGKASDISKAVTYHAGTGTQSGHENEAVAVTFLANKDQNEAESAELWAARFPPNCQVRGSTDDTQLRRITEAAKNISNSEPMLPACDRPLPAVAGISAYLHLQDGTYPVSSASSSVNAEGEGKGEGNSILTSDTATGRSGLAIPRSSTHGCSLMAGAYHPFKEKKRAGGTDVDPVQTLRTVASGTDSSGNGLPAAEGSQQKACRFTFAEVVHPLVVIVRKMCFCLRLHLGSLGKRAVYKNSFGTIHKRSAVDADALITSTSVTRVGAILSVLQCVFYVLPVKAPNSRADPAAKRELLTRQDKKRKLEEEVSSQTQNPLVPLDESESGNASLRLKLEDPPYDGDSRSEAWIHRVILLVLEALFRCSTLVRNEASLHESNKKAEHLVKILAVLQEHFSGQGGQALYAHTQELKHQWEQLTALDPKEQQAEVVAAGAYLLDDFRIRMGAAGMEDIFLQLLAKVRRKVLRQRMERKVQLRQQAVIQPQRFAERRQKRQKKKALVKSVALMNRKRKRMLLES